MSKGQRLVREEVRKQVQQEYQKRYTLEVGVNLKGFCNHYKSFYLAGQPGNAFRLIRTRAFSTAVAFQVPLPNMEEWKQNLEFQAGTNNDLKQGLGVTHWRVGHTISRDGAATFKVRPYYM